MAAWVGCQAKLKSGRRKGQPCGARGKYFVEGNYYCDRHWKPNQSITVKKKTSTTSTQCHYLLPGKTSGSPNEKRRCNKRSHHYYCHLHRCKIEPINKGDCISITDPQFEGEGSIFWFKNRKYYTEDFIEYAETCPNTLLLYNGVVKGGPEEIRERFQIQEYRLANCLGLVKPVILRYHEIFTMVYAKKFRGQLFSNHLIYPSDVGTLILNLKDLVSTRVVYPRDECMLITACSQGLVLLHKQQISYYRYCFSDHRDEAVMEEITERIIGTVSCFYWHTTNRLIHFFSGLEVEPEVPFGYRVREISDDGRVLLMVSLDWTIYPHIIVSVNGQIVNNLNIPSLNSRNNLQHNGCYLDTPNLLFLPHTGRVIKKEKGCQSILLGRCSMCLRESLQERCARVIRLSKLDCSSIPPLIKERYRFQ